MTGKKTWGSTVLGWFVVNEEGESAPTDAGSTESVADRQTDAAAAFVKEIPASPGGRVDFAAVYEAAGIGPEDLTLPALVRRLEAGAVREVIMATNPTLEGDGTALHGTPMVLTEHGVYVREAYLAAARNGDSPGTRFATTRLARGLPAGSNIEYANRNILADAISGRQKM